MLTRIGRTVLGGGAVFTTAGLVFGNWPFFGAGAVLLVLSAFASLAREPLVERDVSTRRIERGGRVTVTLVVDAPRGLGVIEVHQALPDEVELIQGNNFHVVTLGLKAKRVTHTFVVRFPKRGEWTLPPVGVKLVHPLGLAETNASDTGEPIVVVVEPRALASGLPRDLRTRARRPFPDGDLARLGVATTEFRELREYVPGDPPRRINWKATARRIGSGASDVPLVNETEWEGKKCVWILVDGHPRLSVGTNVEDAREAAADAALSLMEEYLRKGYQVGMALVRSGPVPPLRPGTGEAQVRRARELLARLQAAEEPSIMQVIAQNRAHLHRGRPLVVLITRLAADDADVRASLLRLGAIGRLHGRAIVPGFVLDIEPPADAPGTPTDDVVRRALDEERLAMRAAARAAGLRVAHWRLHAEPMSAVLARGRIA